jgi:hypothetical protein
MEAVDILGGIDAMEGPRLVETPGSGLCTRIPCTAGIGVEAVDQRVELALRRRGVQLVVERLHAASVVCLFLLRM